MVVTCSFQAAACSLAGGEACENLNRTTTPLLCKHASVVAAWFGCHAATWVSFFGDPAVQSEVAVQSIVLPRPPKSPTFHAANAQNVTSHSCSVSFSKLYAHTPSARLQPETRRPFLTKRRRACWLTRAHVCVRTHVQLPRERTVYLNTLESYTLRAPMASPSHQYWPIFSRVAASSRSARVHV